MDPINPAHDAHQRNQSQAIRRALLGHLYQQRRANPEAPFVWRRDLENTAGGPVEFELGYLVEHGDIQQDGIKYRITAQGIDRIEQALSQ